MSLEDLLEKLEDNENEELEEVEEDRSTEGTTSSEVREVPAILLPRPGKYYKAVIRKILQGRFKDFIPIENVEDPDVRSRLEAVANDPAIQVWFEVPEIGAVGKQVIRISFHERSKLMELSRCYRSLKVGDSIWVKLDPARGKLTIDCPPPEE